MKTLSIAEALQEGRYFFPKISDFKKLLRELIDHKQNVLKAWDTFKNLAPNMEDADEFITELRINVAKGFIKEEEAKLNHFKKLLALTSTREGVERATDSLNVEKAKMRPINEFVGFDRANFSPCLWHTEHTASMKYYPEDNHVHCFGCHKNGDVIDVVQALYSMDFKSAVKHILNL